MAVNSCIKSDISKDIGDYFLRYNNTLRSLSLNNIQKIGKKFLHSNEVLEVFQCLNTKMSNEEIVSNIIKLIKLLRR